MGKVNLAESLRFVVPARSKKQGKWRNERKKVAYCCLQCGLVMDGDVNAAINVEREARRMLAEGFPVPVSDSGSGWT